MSRLPESVGTIGGGNMAEALLRGLLRAGMKPTQLCASDPVAARRNLLNDALAVRITEDNLELASSCEVVVLAVKPDVVDAAVRGLPAEGGPLFVSIVAGRSTASLRAVLPRGARVVRAMPNTPALVSAGISALADDSGASGEDLERAEGVLGAIGRVLRLPEACMDAVTGTLWLWASLRVRVCRGPERSGRPRGPARRSSSGAGAGDGAWRSAAREGSRASTPLCSGTGSRLLAARPSRVSPRSSKRASGRRYWRPFAPRPRARESSPAIPESAQAPPAFRPILPARDASHTYRDPPPPVQVPAAGLRSRRGRGLPRHRGGRLRGGGAGERASCNASPNGSPASSTPTRAVRRRFRRH